MARAKMDRKQVLLNVISELAAELFLAGMGLAMMKAVPVDEQDDFAVTGINSMREAIEKAGDDVDSDRADG